MYRLRKDLLAILVIVLLICTYAWWREGTDPYSADTWITPFFTTEEAADGSITLSKARDIRVSHMPFMGIILYARIISESIVRVFSRHGETPLSGNASEIVTQLHMMRFNPSRAYIITGGHFPDLYMRNLGIFYSGLLDPRIQDGRADWTARERIALQTVATDLELIHQAGKAYTTFVPIGSQTFVGVNWNDEPSDSLFAIVYTLRALREPFFIAGTLPTEHTPMYTLQTQSAADSLLTAYTPVLTKAINEYINQIMDPKTGLIKKDVRLSGARDNVVQKSGFYDNIIAWATVRNARFLGIPTNCPAIYTHGDACDFDAWKQTIILAFWNAGDGYFFEDQSFTGHSEPAFTGEEFLAVPIGFLDIHDARDASMLTRMVRYVKQNRLDKPFPLIYATADNADKASNIFVGMSSYAGKSIWSHLGQAYIQTLVLLGTYDRNYLNDAARYLERYRENIEAYGGYPELYNTNGEIFSTPFYTSVLLTSWVINYEQTRMLYDDTTHAYVAKVQ